MSQAKAKVFKNIALAGAGRTSGRLALEPSGLSWAGQASGLAEGESRKRRSVRAANIVRTEWFVFGGGCQLKVVYHDAKKQTKGDSKAGEDEDVVNMLRFDGFKPSDFGAVRDIVQQAWKKDLEPARVTSEGGNWGEVDFDDGGAMTFVTPDGNTVLEIPHGEVSQCALPAKNEVEIQFLEDDTAEKDDELLVEMRVYVPTKSAADAESKSNAAQALQNLIKRRAGIMESSAEAICTFVNPTPLFLTPRGRYEVELFARFFRLKGKTYDFKIQYKHVSRFFMLPRPNGTHVAFVISLDEPIRQGKQRYPHLVLQLEEDQHLDLELAIPADEKDSKRFAGLEPTLSGKMWRLMGSMFKRLTQKKVYEPHKDGFTSQRGSKAVKCALKSSDGLLFPLDSSFFFIHKPATHLRFADIQAVEFQRYSAAGATAQRTFDLRVSLKAHSGAGGSEYTFTSIDRAEYGALVKFLQEKRISILNLQSAQGAGEYASSSDEGGAGGDDDSEEEDSDFHSEAGDSDSDALDEAALKALVPETDTPKKRRRAKKPKKAQASDGSGSDDAGSGGGEGSADEGARPAKKQRRASASSGGSDAGGDSGGDSE